MGYNVYTNFSNGYVVEVVEDGKHSCSSWILIPAENLWGVGLRTFLYLLAMIYIFIGVAIASDVFMCSIEVITSKRRTVVKWDEERQERVEKEVLVWNETVANLTLMALGSSAPEIMLAVMETCQNLDSDEVNDGLGTFTIIGSAAFNLLIITAICILSVPDPEIRRVREFGVFLLTAVWSIFAYIWMLIVVQFISPGEIDRWEAWLTLGFFPILVIMAYAQDNGWWRHKCCKNRNAVDAASQINIRVISDKSNNTMIHGMSKELQALEREKQRSQGNLLRAEDGDYTDRTHVNKDGDGSSVGSQTHLVMSTSTRPTDQHQKVASKQIARARFRHAAVRSLMGGKRHAPPTSVTADAQRLKMTDVVSAARKQGLTSNMSPEELVGKFTFSSPSYSVLESAGVIELEVLFHRKPPTKANPIKMANGNGVPPENGHNETSLSAPVSNFGCVSVEFETREGSAKIDKDFKFSTGKLDFKETEYLKTITVPIINDNQYEADVDFYLILKNSVGDSGLGDPSVTRITIIDDDEPGEFQFEAPHYYADTKTGMLTVNVVRHKGCDGTVTLEYSTIDGTAKGGATVSDYDYKTTEGVLNFKHNETSQLLSVPVSTEAKGSKNFIITLRNPSLGAKIGDHSAAVCNITSDDLAERIADVMDDGEETTYSGQFVGAMVLETGRDDNGREIPLKWFDYLLHFLTFFWKLVFAFVPPRRYLGAWPTFCFSLLTIGGLTALIEQLGSLLGCVVGLRPSIAGITIIAIGTSLPDTFASRTAALHDEGADMAIGNITGSNSVNVFLGLGLPWVISTMYNHYVKGRKYRVATGTLVSSVIIFSIIGTVCIIMLIIRRYTVGGELGGKKKSIKYLSGLFLISLWVFYIIISTLIEYFPHLFPW